MQKKQYLRRRKRAHDAPYPLSIYRNLLLQAQQKSDISVQPFLRQKALNKANLFVRHDVDTASCVKNLPHLTQINRELGIQAGIYFRVDDQEYSLAKHKRVVASLRDAGFEVGLHTVCYLRDDYLKALELETEKFLHEAGFQPLSFTVHGLGSYRAEVRQRFYLEVGTKLADLGYQFTDCGRHLRTYEYVIEDCHRDERGGQRFIYSDFLRIPHWFRAGGEYLVLTHPCYWEQLCEIK